MKIQHKIMKMAHMLIFLQVLVHCSHIFERIVDYERNSEQSKNLKEIENYSIKQNKAQLKNA